MTNGVKVVFKKYLFEISDTDSCRVTRKENAVNIKKKKKKVCVKEEEPHTTGIRSGSCVCMEQDEEGRLAHSAKPHTRNYCIR